MIDLFMDRFLVLELPGMKDFVPLLQVRCMGLFHRY
jgi:hypothetical protein